MTNQELFDRSAVHLLTQKKKSIEVDEDQDFRCKYRAPNGSKCAIGALIPDEKYSNDLEGFDAGRTSVRKAAGISLEQTGLALALQDVHDNCDVPEWRAHLESIAARFGLSTAAIDAIPG